MNTTKKDNKVFSRKTNNFQEKYVSIKAQKLHQVILIKTIKAFNESDLKKFKKEVDSFLKSPSLNFHLSCFNFSTIDEKNSLTKFKFCVEFWLKHVYFMFSEREISAIYEAGKDFNRREKSSDEFLFFVLSSIPKDIIEEKKKNQVKVKKEPKLKEKEKADLSFL